MLDPNECFPPELFTLNFYFFKEMIPILLEAHEQPLAASVTALTLSSLLPIFKRSFIIVRQAMHCSGGE